MPSILILDFEAHPDVRGKLFPVEIGVSALDGRTAAHWITPRPEWTPGRPTWHLHAALLDSAFREGKPADGVAAWLSRIAVGKRILSDCLPIDVPLLARLVKGGPHPMLEDFFTVAKQEAEQRGIPDGTINRWICEIDETSGPAHRAGPDTAARAALLQRIFAHQ